LSPREATFAVEGEVVFTDSFCRQFLMKNNKTPNPIMMITGVKTEDDFFKAMKI
jgi:hypothetical protein